MTMNAYCGLLCGVLLGACAPMVQGPDDLANNKIDGASQNICVPGSSRNCYCLGAGAGKQLCNADGQDYSACMDCVGGPDLGPVTVIDAGGGNPCGNCDGCCNGTTCVAFAQQAAMTCGAAGKTCAACASGDVCDGVSGTCVTSTSTCGACGNGCCGIAGGSPHCYVSTPSNCGTNAGTCTTCPNGTLCNGTCNDMIDPNTLFRVFVSKTQVFNTDGNGNCWDNYAGFGCAQPDLFVCLAYDDGNGYIAGCTTVITDVPIDNGRSGTDNLATDTASWTMTTGGVIQNGGNTFYIPGSSFINGKVIVYVQDYDNFNSNDLIGTAGIAALTMENGGSYATSAFQRVVDVDFTLF